jgi:hypothetical protein
VSKQGDGGQTDHIPEADVGFRLLTGSAVSASAYPINGNSIPTPARVGKLPKSYHTLETYPVTGYTFN